MRNKPTCCLSWYIDSILRLISSTSRPCSVFPPTPALVSLGIRRIQISCVKFCNKGHVCFLEFTFWKITFQIFLYLFAIRKVDQRKILSSQRKIWFSFQESVFPLAVFVFRKVVSRKPLSKLSCVCLPLEKLVNEKHFLVKGKFGLVFRKVFSWKIWAKNTFRKLWKI